MLKNTDLRWLKKYVQNSGAFYNYSNDYQMTEDKDETWVYNGKTYGYKIVGTPEFTLDELQTYNYNETSVTVEHYDPNQNINGETETYYKSYLIFAWMGLKLFSKNATDSPPTIGDAYFQALSAASNLTILTGIGQPTYQGSIPGDCLQGSTSNSILSPYRINRFCGPTRSSSLMINAQTDTVSQVNATDLASYVNASLSLMTNLGTIHITYPEKKTTCDGGGLFGWLICLVQTIINVVVTVVTAIVKLVVSVINFIVHAWDDLLSKTLGAVVNVLNTIANDLLTSVVDVLINPILSADLYSPNSNQFSMINYSTIKTQIVETFDSVESAINSTDSPNLSEFSSITNFNFNIPLPLSGILGQLVELSGPFILETVLQIVADTILNQIIVNIPGPSSINIDKLITSLFGMSEDELGSLIDTFSSLDTFFDKPLNLISNIKNLLINFNFAEFNLDNSSSLGNTNGLSAVIIVLENIYSILSIPLDFLFSGTNSNINNNMIKQGVNSSNQKTAYLTDLKTQTETDLKIQIIFDIVRNLAIYGKSKQKRTSNNNNYAIILYDIGLIGISFFASLASVSLSSDLNYLKKGNNIISILTLVNIASYTVDFITRFCASIFGFTASIVGSAPKYSKWEQKVLELNSLIQIFFCLYKIGNLLINIGLSSNLEEKFYDGASLFSNIVKLIGSSISSLDIIDPELYKIVSASLGGSNRINLAIFGLGELGDIAQLIFGILYIETF